MVVGYHVRGIPLKTWGLTQFAMSCNNSLLFDRAFGLKRRRSCTLSATRRGARFSNGEARQPILVPLPAPPNICFLVTVLGILDMGKSSLLGTTPHNCLLVTVSRGLLDIEKAVASWRVLVQTPPRVWLFNGHNLPNPGRKARVLVVMP